MRFSFAKCHQHFWQSRAKQPMVFRHSRSSATVTTNIVFWDMTPCSPLKWLPFRRDLLPPSLNCDNIWSTSLLLTARYCLPSYTASHSTSLRTSPMQSVNKNRDKTLLAIPVLPTHVLELIQFPSYGTEQSKKSWAMLPFATVNSERPNSANIIPLQCTKCGWKAKHPASTPTAQCCQQWLGYGMDDPEFEIWLGAKNPRLAPGPRKVLLNGYRGSLP